MSNEEYQQQRSTSLIDKMRDYSNYRHMETKILEFHKLLHEASHRVPYSNTNEAAEAAYWCRVFQEMFTIKEDGKEVI